MAMKWITHTGLGVSTILIIMILFIGTVGHMIHFTDMVIHRGTILSITRPGVGVDMACIRLTADGDGAFHPIIVTTIHTTEAIMVMVDIMVVMEDIMEVMVVMVVITTTATMQTQVIMITDKEDQLERMLTEITEVQPQIMQ